jgi:hypothetical protein
MTSQLLKPKKENLINKRWSDGGSDGQFKPVSVKIFNLQFINFGLPLSDFSLPLFGLSAILMFSSRVHHFTIFSCEMSADVNFDFNLIVNKMAKR